jgi:transcriptional regulator of acetoin/glycerol metabolism
MDRSRMMFPNPVQERLVHKAWEAVIRGGARTSASLRDVVSHSWQRCLKAQVDPHLGMGPSPVSPEDLALQRESRRDMLHASAPVMACARDYLAEAGSIMILTDASGMILASEGDPAARDKASQIHLMPGVRWSESLCGTNAIGTALETGEAVQIHSAEHFCAGIKDWTCAAAVVRHPTDGDILGALDVSGLSGTFNRQLLALAVSTGKRIEKSLAIVEMERRYRLLDASIEWWRLVGEDGAVLFDRRGTPIKANDTAARAIASLGGNNSWLRNMARLSALAHWTLQPDDLASLPPWMRPEWLQPVVVRGEHLGTMLVVPLGLHTRSGVSMPAARRLAAASSDAFARLVHGDGPMAEVIRRARQLAAARTAVLLQGETGVGKEEFARGLHGNRQGSYVALNCGGLARELLASELFGHAEGAFTGARKGGTAGKIEAADGGTLFLDEIGEMPLDMQPMLLRVLEQGEVYRLLENKPRKVEFKLVAATHRDLREEVAAGRFRRDLFYRIAVTTLRIPSLRERPGDVALLASHYLRHFRQQRGEIDEPLSPEVIECLTAYHWPGNIRELRNVIEAAVLLSNGEPLRLDVLPPELLAGVSARRPTDDAAGVPAADSSRASTLDEAEREAIRRAIVAEQGNLTRAAKRLAIAKSTLYLKMQALGLTRHEVLG